MKLPNPWWRVKMLATGHVTWVDTATGDEEHEQAGWKLRWTLAGMHSYQWGWVRRHGRLPCGCTRNPLTRRMVLYSGACTVPHSATAARIMREVRDEHQ